MLFTPDGLREVTRKTVGANTVLRFREDWALFAGHFPGTPVVPAWILVGAARALAERWVGAPLEIASLDRAKLMRPVGPDEPVVLELTVTREGERWRVKAQLSTAAGSVGTIALVLVAA